MGYYPLKLRSTDTMFSKYIRRGGKCEMRGLYGIECSSKLEAAHYHGRSHENTRHDTENVVCLCFNHHKATHEDKKIFTDFMIKKLGQKKYDLLTLRANTYCKRDDVMTKLYIKELLKEDTCETK